MWARSFIASSTDCVVPVDRVSFDARTIAARLSVELAELGVPPDALCGGMRASHGGDETDVAGRAWPLAARAGGAHAQAASELARQGVVDGQLLEGVIDRTFVDESGHRWIVDFKTSTHEGGGLERFSMRKSSVTGPTAALCALMRRCTPGRSVRAALYFPMMRQWREVALD